MAQVGGIAREIKLLSVVGARPQFIKAAAMSLGIHAWNQESDAPRFKEVIVHTGQHYDHELSETFFEELKIPNPRVNLDVKSGSHAVQTAKMMVGLEKLMQEQSPDWVIVFGDTNSTLAGVLAAAKLRIPVAHVEAGLREHNRHIPEEVNKIVSDHLADLCFAPTKLAMENLAREGLAERSVLVGDIMLDTTRRMLESQSKLSVTEILARFGVRSNEFALATTHRAIIRERGELLREVLGALREMPIPVVLPLHPSTRSAIEHHHLEALIEPGTNLRVVSPVKYSEMIILLSGCRMVLSDSGGLIKEAYYFRKPCITLDYQTEWIETLEGGWNVVAGPNKERILAAARTDQPLVSSYRNDVFGDGNSADKILKALSIA